MNTVLNWLQQGGPAMAVLVAMSVAALSIVIVKGWEYFDLHINRRSFVTPVLDAWGRGATGDALRLLKGEPNPLARVMASAIQLSASGTLPEEQRRELAAQFAAERLESARHLLRPLEVIATLAPLLGLFGTVLGMIEAFQQLKAGNAGDAAALSGGIAEALLSTAAGLAVAIPSTAALHFFERIVERLHLDMESALTRIFVRPPQAWTAPVEAPANAAAPVGEAA